jgi:hypothetical protein
MNEKRFYITNGSVSNGKDYHATMPDVLDALGKVSRQKLPELFVHSTLTGNCEKATKVLAAGDDAASLYGL